MSAPLRYLTVEFSPTGVAEIDPANGSRLHFVPKEKIRSVELGYGALSERAIYSALFGVALIVSGVYVFYYYADFVRSLCSVAIFGAWAIYDATKRGHFVRVKMNDGGERRLALRGEVAPTVLDEFVRDAADCCGLPRT